jgi:hypothetical protein
VGDLNNAITLYRNNRNCFEFKTLYQTDTEVFMQDPTPSAQLEQLSGQIDSLLKLASPRPTAAVDTYWIVITRLYQVSKTQLKNIPKEVIEKFLLKLFDLQNHYSDLNTLMSHAERALWVIEKYDEANPKALFDLQIKFNNFLGDLRRKSQLHKATPAVKPQPSTMRMDAKQAEDQIIALRHLCESLLLLEKSGAAAEKIDVQRKLINKVAHDYFHKQMQYWSTQPGHKKWLNIKHEEMRISMRQGEAQFSKAFEKFDNHFSKCLSIGAYDRARNLLAYNGLSQSEPNRAEDFPLTKLLKHIIYANVGEFKAQRENFIPPGPWQRYRDFLHKTRSQLCSDLKQGKNLGEIQPKLSKDFISTVATTICRIEMILGACPSRYAVFMNGSGARNDMGAYPDVDIDIITDNNQDPATLQWIQNALQILQFEVEAIGESDKKIKGFHFDSGSISVDLSQKEPRLRGIYKPKEYAVESKRQFLHAEDYTKYGACFVFGDKALAAECKASIPQPTENEFKHMFAETSHELCRIKRKIDDTNDLKNEYLHPFNRAIAQLGLMHSYPRDKIPYPFAVLDWLSQKEILADDFIKLCKQKLGTLYQQRMLRDLEQNGWAKEVAGAPGVLSLIQLEQELQIINDEVLKPLGNYLRWLSQDKPRALPKKVHPAHFPNADGTRYELQLEQKHWEQQVHSSFTPDMPTVGLPAVKIQLTNGQRYLPENVIKALQSEGWLDQTGQFNISKMQNKPAIIQLNTLVPPVTFTIFPSRPPIEHFANDLCRHLVGRGVPNESIGCLEASNKTFYIAVSPIETQLSSDINSQQTIDKLKQNKKVFAKMFLLHVLNLINPNGSAQQPCSLDQLFSLPQMRDYFDNQLKKELCSIDIYFLLTQWIQQLSQIEKALPKKGLLVPEGIIAKIYTKLAQLQQRLSTENVSSEQTYIYLLKQLEPELGRIYDEKLDKSAEDSLQSSRKGQGSPTKTLSQDITIEQALKELETVHHQGSDETPQKCYEKELVRKLESTNDDYQKELLINEINFAELSRSTEDKVIKIMKQTCFTQLRLNGCAIKAKELEEIIKNSPELKEFILKNMPQIDETLWPMLETNAPKLLRLHLHGLDNLAYSAKSPSEAFLLRLQQLNVSKCATFSKILGVVELQDITKSMAGNKRVRQIHESEILQLIDKCPLLLIVKREQWLTAPIIELKKMVIEGAEIFYTLKDETDNNGAIPVLIALRTNTRLKTLRFEGNGINARGVEFLIKALECNKSLRRVYLHGNEIGARGADMLAQVLRKNCNLERIDLGGNQLGDTGAIAIVTALQTVNTRLSVSLMDNELTSASVPALIQLLENNQKMCLLELENNKFTEADIRLLQETAKRKRIEISTDKIEQTPHRLAAPALSSSHSFFASTKPTATANAIPDTGRSSSDRPCLLAARREALFQPVNTSNRENCGTAAYDKANQANTTAVKHGQVVTPTGAV